VKTRRSLIAHAVLGVTLGISCLAAGKAEAQSYYRNGVRVYSPGGAYRDYDRDGIPNYRDRDIDNDGINNSRDRNDYSRSNRVRVRHRVQGWRGDFDRDGIRNRRDRDIDGDGRKNWSDRDRDGDGVRNKYDQAPNKPRRR
jgi:hypothetical protein